MRKLLAGAGLAVLATALPAGAETADATAPCAAVDGTEVLTPAGLDEAFAPSPVPAVGHDFDDLAGEPPAPVPALPPLEYRQESVVAFDYVLDVSGSTATPDAQQATVAIALGWDNDSDFDLYVYDAAGNVLSDANSFNPLDGSGEAASLGNVAHCTVLRIEVVNYAGVPTSAMTLDTKVTRLK